MNQLGCHTMHAVLQRPLRPHAVPVCVMRLSLRLFLSLEVPRFWLSLQAPSMLALAAIPLDLGSLKTYAKTLLTEKRIAGLNKACPLDVKDRPRHCKHLALRAEHHLLVLSSLGLARLPTHFYRPSLTDSIICLETRGFASEKLSEPIPRLVEITERYRPKDEQADSHCNKTRCWC